MLKFVQKTQFDAATATLAFKRFQDLDFVIDGSFLLHRDAPKSICRRHRPLQYQSFLDCARLEKSFFNGLVTSQGYVG